MTKQRRTIQTVSFGVACGLMSGVALADHPPIGFGIGTGGPIVTIPADTAPKGSWGIGFDVSYTQADAYSDAELQKFAGEHVHAHSSDYLLSTSLGASYGVTDDFTVGARLPFIHREDIRSPFHSHVGGVTTNAVTDQGDSNGLGDLTVMGKYRFLKAEQQNIQAALLFGIKAPTGQTDEKNDQGLKFETEQQPGSGSWDPLLGLATTFGFGPVSVSGSFLYSFAGEGSQDTDLGNRAFYNIGVFYRLPEAAHEHGLESVPHGHSNWDVGLELNGEWQQRERIDGVEQEDSGGNMLYLSPGVRYTAKNNLSFYLSVGIPIDQKIRKSHPDTDYRVIFGLGMPL